MHPIEVLMVEDNLGDVVLFREALIKAGVNYQINVAKDGVDALEYLRGLGKYTHPTRPDLILLDLKLPRKNGREVMDDLRLDSDLNTILLIVLSSSRSELALAHLQNLPEQNYIVKPSTFAGYVALVKQIETIRLNDNTREGRLP